MNEIIMPLIMFIIIISLGLIWLWSIINVLSENKNSSWKILWMLVIISFSILGSFLYYMIEYRKLKV